MDWEPQEGKVVHPEARRFFAEPRAPEGTVAREGCDYGLARGRSCGLDPALLAGSRHDPVLVGGVSYPWLTDLGLGVVLANEVASWGRPGVAVADFSDTPVAAFQTITDGAFQALLLIGAEKRGAGAINDGEPSLEPGRVHTLSPQDYPPIPSDQVAEVVGLSTMGAMTIENIIRIGQAFGGIPPKTQILAVEPFYDSWANEVGEFTPPVARAVPEVLRLVRAWLDEATATLRVSQ